MAKKKTYFEIRKAKDGFYPRIRSSNGEITFHGESHKTKASCKKTIRSTVLDIQEGLYEISDLT